jgi:hypothetical protein
VNIINTDIASQLAEQRRDQLRADAEQDRLARAAHLARAASRIRRYRLSFTTAQACDATA